MMKHSASYLAFLCLVSALLAALLYNGRQVAMRAKTATIPAKRQLVRSLGLTDLSLWSEARYSRHPSQADLFTPFQDAPGAAEHFPAGSIIAAQSPKPTTRIRVSKPGSP